MTQQKQAIGVFDSGLGGLSVLRKIHEMLPYEALSYIADSAHAPYGDKSESDVIHRCQTLVDFFQTQEIKALVIACNTATAAAAEVLRQQLNIPVIGMEPAIKPAARQSTSKTIGVLATKHTIQSQRLKNLIVSHAANVTVLTQACPGLVEHVEMGDFTSLEVRKLLDHYATPLIAQGADTLVLGCSHYPFLQETLKQHIGHDVEVLETSTPVTQHLIRTLRQKQLLQKDQIKRQPTFYTSKLCDKHEQAFQSLWHKDIQVKQLPKEFL